MRQLGKNRASQLGGLSRRMATQAAEQGRREEQLAETGRGRGSLKSER